MHLICAIRGAAGAGKSLPAPAIDLIYLNAFISTSTVVLSVT